MFAAHPVLAHTALRPLLLAYCSTTGTNTTFAPATTVQPAYMIGGFRITSICASLFFVLNSYFEKIVHRPNKTTAAHRLHLQIARHSALVTSHMSGSSRMPFCDSESFKFTDLLVASRAGSRWQKKKKITHESCFQCAL